MQSANRVVFASLVHRESPRPPTQNRPFFSLSSPFFRLPSHPPLHHLRSHSLARVRTHSRQAFFVFHLHPFTTHPNLLMHNAFRVKALPSPFPSLGFTGRSVFSPRPCAPSHAFDASPPQTAKGEAKKTKTFTPNARSLNKLRKVGEAVKAKNENLWTRVREGDVLSFTFSALPSAQRPTSEKSTAGRPMSRENTNFVSGAAPRRRRPTQTAHECTPALGGRRNRSAPPPLPFSRKTRLRHRHRHQRQRRGGALSHTALRPRAARRKHARPLRTRNPRRHQRGATRRARGDGHQKRGRGPHGPSHRRTDCRLSAQTRQPDADTHGAEKEHPPPRDCAGANRIGLSP